LTAPSPISRRASLVDNPNADWSISQTTRDSLRTIVADGMERGATNDDLARDILDATTFSRDRADMIARTESAMADVNGTYAGWKASGVVAGKQFMAAPDCCDECQESDGEIVEIDDEFSAGEPPLHPNCRCGVLAVLPEDMPGADNDETDAGASEE